MKKLALALVIISLLTAPEVLAEEKSLSSDDHGEVSLNSPIKSQEEFHESEEAQIHENEPFDDEDETSTPIASSSPTGSPTATATPTGSPVATPSESPTASPSPSGSPIVAGINVNSSALDTISGLLQQILQFLQSLGHHE